MSRTKTKVAKKKPTGGPKGSGGGTKAPPVTVETSAKTNADKIELPSVGRTTQFAGVLEQAKTLKIGEALEIGLSRTDKKTLINTRNWLAQLIKRVTAPKGGHLRARTTVTGKLAIVCQKSK